MTSARMHVSSLSSPERLSAVRETGLLDSPAEAPFDRITQLVCRVLRVPVSLVSLVDADRQFFKSQQGLPERWGHARETPLSHSFCQHVVTGEEPLVINDARNNPLVCDNLAIPQLGVAAYLGVPLRTPDGHILGSLCAIDTEPHPWGEEDLLTLQDLAQVVMGEIALRSEIERRRESEEQLALLGQELTHRIKNIFAVTGSLVALSATAGGTIEDVVAAVRQRLNALARAHDYVRPKTSEGSEAECGSPLGGLLQALLGAYRQEQLEIGKCDQIVGPKAAQALALVFHETATNAVKYGALSDSKGCLRITCEELPGEVLISWRETGGPRLNAAPEHRGFGSLMAERIARSQLDADLQRTWNPEGLVLTLRLPTHRLAA